MSGADLWDNAPRAAKNDSADTVETGQSRPLSRTQQRFVEEYRVDGDAAGAALRAGYSAGSAARAAARNLRHPAVLAALGVGAEEGKPRNEVTPDRVVRELAAIGFTTLRDVCRWDGEHLELMDSASLSAEQVAAIAEITETSSSRGSTVRVKLHSKLRALELLARHVGLYADAEALRTGASGEDTGEGDLALPQELQERVASIYGELEDRYEEENASAPEEDFPPIV